MASRYAANVEPLRANPYAGHKNTAILSALLGRISNNRGTVTIDPHRNTLPPPRGWFIFDSGRTWCPTRLRAQVLVLISENRSQKNEYSDLN